MPKWLNEDFSWVRPVLSVLGRVVLVVGGIALIGYVGYWLLYRGPLSYLSDPTRQQTIPTAIASPTSRVLDTRWAQHDWLTSDEAFGLRTREDVVNLAYLANGGVLYSRTYSIPFNQDSWEKAKPFGLTELSVNGTAVSFRAYGANYNLNVYQPFVLEQRGNDVFVVDQMGQLWRATLDSVELRPIAEVVGTLPLGIEANASLSLSYGR